MSMTFEELEKLKERLELSKEEKAKAQGSIDQIEKNWKDDFDCDSKEEVEKTLSNIKDQIKSLEKKKEELESNIEKVMEGC